MFKVNNRNTRTRCDICSKLKIMTSLWRRFIPCSNVSIVNFEQSNTGCEACTQNPITLKFEALNIQFYHLKTPYGYFQGLLWNSFGSKIVQKHLIVYAPEHHHLLTLRFS